MESRLFYCLESQFFLKKVIAIIKKIRILYQRKNIKLFSIFKIWLKINILYNYIAYFFNICNFGWNYAKKYIIIDFINYNKLKHCIKISYIYPTKFNKIPNISIYIDSWNKISK